MARSLMKSRAPAPAPAPATPLLCCRRRDGVADPALTPGFVAAIVADGSELGWELFEDAGMTWAILNTVSSVSADPVRPGGTMDVGVVA